MVSCVARFAFPRAGFGGGFGATATGRAAGGAITETRMAAGRVTGGNTRNGTNSCACPTMTKAKDSTAARA